MSREDSDYYHGRINEGGIFVSVSDDGTVDRSRVQDILHRAGGHNANSSQSGGMGSGMTGSTTSTTSY